MLPPPNEHGNNPQLAAVETVVPRTGTANGCTAALRTAVSVPSNKTGWVAVAGDLEASTSATGAGASAPQLLTRAEYLLMLTSDYCFTETNQSHSRRLEMSDAAAAEALALAGPAQVRHRRRGWLRRGWLKHRTPGGACQRRMGEWMPPSKSSRRKTPTAPASVGLAMVRRGTRWRRRRTGLSSPQHC